MITLRETKDVEIEQLSQCYKKGVIVWIRDAEKIWIEAELLDDVAATDKEITLKLNTDELKKIKISVPEALPYIRNPEILLGSDDLTTLSYLHEPAVLNNLRFRFIKRECIYAYCGVVLVAINPYTDCSHLYSNEVIQVYRGVGNQVRELDPHIYAVAEEAFYDLNEFHRNQSIIVSGESGAGKTVSAKFVMRYLATVTTERNALLTQDANGIEAKVLASNPILEAIGNAKTIRNDNSSRFGKFIQINFNAKLAITGAEMKTYLLEKIRVVSQAYNERNYHIFYQICASRSHHLLKDLRILDPSAYSYTNQGGDCRIPCIDDSDEFESLLNAFDLLNFSSSSLQSIFKIFTGILYFGNITFDKVGDAVIISNESDETISFLCSTLFEIDQHRFKVWLCEREICASNEAVRMRLNNSQAVTNRDALAKKVYESLFLWIVKQINEVLGNYGKQEIDKFIGVLDIYGFEMFDTNSFEQFCINYANEKLQQQFNQHVFKLEQLEYEKEDISWIRIEFHDNQSCIDLIECRPGIIDYLDEYCKMGRGTDDDWLEALKNCSVMKQRGNFELPKIKNPEFTIKHFASDVVYQIDGFLEKNKDSFSEQLMNVLRGTRLKFLSNLLRDSPYPQLVGKSSQSLVVTVKKVSKKSVSIQFRDSLRSLMSILNETRPHYVRCIKPNDNKLSYSFDAKRVIQQLRACGVLETVRISAAGYPSRWLYDDFCRRYRMLRVDSKSLWRENPKAFSEKICQAFMQQKMFALGKTKIFFRTGQVALLEQIRYELLSMSALIIQKTWRRYVAKCRYQHIRSSLFIVQAVTKAFIIYRRLKYLQIHRACVCIQAFYRRYICAKRYNQIHRTILWIQSAYRGHVAQQKFEKLRYEQKAIVIQRYWRGWHARRHQIKINRRIILVQCCIRRWLARRKLKALKIEARSVGHLQTLNKGLENKIISLQRKLDVLVFENSKMTEKCAKLNEMQVRLNALEKEKLTLAAEALESNNLRREIETLRDENQELIEHNGKLSSKLKHYADEFRTKEAILKEQSHNITNQLNDSFKCCEKLQTEKLSVQLELSNANERLVEAECEISKMRDQLLANANLLASPTLSRVGSLRFSGNHTKVPFNAKLDSSEVDLEEELTNSSCDIDAITLIMKQQKVITEFRSKIERISRENENLKSIIDVDALNEKLERRLFMKSFGTQRYQELELAYSKLKIQLDQMIEERIVDGEETNYFQLLVEKALEENDRIREESAELRALLASRFERDANSVPHHSGLQSLSNSRGEDTSLSDMEEELSLTRQCRQYRAYIENLIRTVAERTSEVEALEKQLNEFSPSKKSLENGCSTTEALSTVDCQLVLENLNLQTKLNRQADELAETRAQLKGFSNELGCAVDSTSDSDVIRLNSLRRETIQHSSLLEIFNVPEFVRILIYDLKPRLARLLTPCLPAYLLLAAYRYYDHAKDEASLTALFTSVHSVLKETTSRSTDMDALALWLVNLWKLLNLLRQYSGEESKEWYALNTETQNAQRMQNFDLAPIRNQLCARVEEYFQSLMKRVVEPILSPKIVPGILQHESSTDLTPNSDNRSSVGKNHLVSRTALDDLIELLNFLHAKLKCYGADTVLMGQIFGQIVYWICALALNHLMFRKELCNFEKAIQIKHNVTEIQSWLSTNGLEIFRDVLEPLVQASHLLQSKKDESNLDTLCGEMTSKLKPKQVVAILQHYVPSDGFEERRLDSNLLVKISQRLFERARANGIEETGQKELIMMGTYLKPFDTQRFVHSDFPLETLSLPAALHLVAVCRLL